MPGTGRPFLEAVSYSNIFHSETQASFCAPGEHQLQHGWAQVPRSRASHVYAVQLKADSELCRTHPCRAWEPQEASGFVRGKQQAVWPAATCLGYLAGVGGSGLVGKSPLGAYTCRDREAVKAAEPPPSFQ